MATGIISIACFLLGMRTISLVLLVVNVVAFLILWLLLLLRLLFFFPRVKATSGSRARSGVLYCCRGHLRAGKSC